MRFKAAYRQRMKMLALNEAKLPMSTYTEDYGWRVPECPVCGKRAEWKWKGEGIAEFLFFHEGRVSTVRLTGDVGIVQRDIYLAYLRHHRPPAELNPELLAYFRSFA